MSEDDISDRRTAPQPGGPAVAAVGGGHGLAVSLRAAMTFAGSLSAVVSTADDGGSSGRLRADIAMPAPGDLRRCLAAVAGDAELAEALEHRFGAGDLAGHAVGNLVLAGLVDAGHDLEAAARRLHRWLDVDPAVQVLPATCVPVDLEARTADGVVRGQVAVEASGPIEHLAVVPADVAVPAAVPDAIAAADLVVLGPGSFYTSVLAAAVVPAVRAAIADHAKVVWVANLRAQESNVKGLDVAAHIDVLAAHDIRPHIVVTQDDGIPLGDLGPDAPNVVVADVDRPHGLAHDAALLGAVLAGL